MALVYFESLNSDGTLSPNLIPAEQIAVVRPLNADEIDYAAKLADGFFEQKVPAVAIKEAKAKVENFNTSHPSAKSALQTVAGNKYYFAQPVEEFTSNLANLIILNGDPSTIQSDPQGAPPNSGGPIGSPELVVRREVAERYGQAESPAATTPAAASIERASSMEEFLQSVKAEVEGDRSRGNSGASRPGTQPQRGRSMGHGR